MIRGRRAQVAELGRVDALSNDARCSKHVVRERDSEAAASGARLGQGGVVELLFDGGELLRRDGRVLQVVLGQEPHLAAMPTRSSGASKAKQASVGHVPSRRAPGA